MWFQGHILSENDTDVDKKRYPPAESEKDLVFEDTKKITALAVFFKASKHYLPDGPYWE